MSKHVLAFLVLIMTSLAACPANSNINNILAGTHASLSRLRNIHHQCQFFDQPTNLQLSVSDPVLLRPLSRTWYLLPNPAIQNFALNFVGPNSFAVAPQTISTTGNQFLFSFTPAVWSSITVNFFVSSNPQLQVGFLSVGKYFFMQPVSSSEATTVRDAHSSTTIFKLLLPKTRTPSSASSSMASLLMPRAALCKCLSAQPTSRTPSSPSRSHWARPP